MLEKLPFWGQILLVVAIAIGIVGFTYWVMPNLAEKRSQIVQLEQDWAKKDREIQKGRAIEQRIQEFEREVAPTAERLGYCYRVNELLRTSDRVDPGFVPETHIGRRRARWLVTRWRRRIARLLSVIVSRIDVPDRSDGD